MGFLETTSHLAVTCANRNLDWFSDIFVFFHFSIFFIFSESLKNLGPRSLDQDIGNVMRAADESFDWNRISFVLEAWTQELFCFPRKPPTNEKW